MQPLAESLDKSRALQSMVVPDLWQQQAVGALRQGRDVVVHAPTGAGKTLIFELWSHQGKPRSQAIYTVPTRALANDKLAEWRARGWNVGIATGDLADNLDAPVLVATLETQKHRLIQGVGPSLLVVDEYQMLADPDRGLNYELALALAPASTQLLLLSGSVANPQEVVRWLERLGRRALLVRHDERPVPLEEVHASQLNAHVPAEIRGYWPRLVVKALAEDLGPILIFAPRRQAAEALAAELGRSLPTPNPLQLTPAQKQLAGDSLARLLRSRVAYHHSGLAYAVRAGILEPLAKAGQLRVVVATMGLAAGINFSLRSVALAGESYRRDQAEQPLRSDEILQMFGRAGRRGIDETGYVLVSSNGIRLLDAHVTQLARNGMIDWSALLGIMHSAAEQTRPPFPAAVQAQQRLFTTKPIVLGVEEALKHPDTPCQLGTDAERARWVRRRIRQIRNSHGQWQAGPAHTPVPLRDVRVLHFDSAQPDAPPTLRPALSEPAAVAKAGPGEVCLLDPAAEHPTYGRQVTVAERYQADQLVLAKWVRRLVAWNGRVVRLAIWQQQVEPLLRARLAELHTPLLTLLEQPNRIVAHLSLAEQPIRVPVDESGVALWKPPEREVGSAECQHCALSAVCHALSPAPGTALLWRRLGLVEANGVPTQRGRLVSFFAQGDGLAVSAALEDAAYPLEELVYDLANLDAGFRFCGDDSRWAGRLARVCQEKWGLQTIPGYLENGLPPKYGAGAETVVAALHRDPTAKFAWTSDTLGTGDIDRIVIEWRSLLRRIAHAPELDWPRWLALRQLAAGILRETTSPTLTELPPLDFAQTKRIDHRLILRRH